MGRNSLSYLGPKLWNNLPCQLKLSKSRNIKSNHFLTNVTNDPNGTTLFPLCYHFVTTLLPLCYHFVTTLLPLCYHFVTTLLLSCYHCYLSFNRLTMHPILRTYSTVFEGSLWKQGKLPYIFIPVTLCLRTDSKLVTLGVFFVIFVS